MIIPEIAALPARPDSVAEWEDLLVRLEIASRALRVTLEDIGEEEAASRVLERAIAREEQATRFLEAAAELPESGLVEAAKGSGLPHLALRFTSLRARNFAMVQRRGLEVWEWDAPLDGGERVTVHQLLGWLAQRDAALLAELRAIRGSGRGEC